ncbi:MAG: flagellar M-ring protein FliF C-terminal domain-containing protein, partial [Clostridiales bacterium]
EITDALTEATVDYKFSDDKKSILVNDKDKSKAQVATLGFIKGGMEFEDAFNMIKLNTTESDKEKLWTEYKKKNLASKLEAISDNIEIADVDLDIPEESLFVNTDEDKRKATARVIVKPKQQLTESQVEGVASMVAGSISGLDIKDVVVLDDNLNVLNKDSTDGEMGGISSLNNREKLRTQKAKELEDRIYKLYGESSDSFDGIKVVANPVLNFDTLKSVTKDVEVPDGMDEAAGIGVKVSESTTKEEAKEDGSAQQPGTDTNPGDTVTYPNGTTGEGSYKKQTATTNYDYKKTETEQEKAPGSLIGEESSIALALYYGRDVTDDKNISNEFIDELKEGVSQATGISVNKISINKFKMAPLKVEKISIYDTIKSLINDYGMFALMLLLVLGLFIALFPRKKKEEPEEALEDLEEGEEGADFIVPDDEPLPELDLEEISEVRKQIDKFVKQKPDAVAQLLRNWLSDDWD